MDKTDQPDEDVEVLLAQLPPEMQWRARSMLHDWGVAPSGNDGFTIRLALITRLQLYTLVKSAVTLTRERRLIEDQMSDLRKAFARDAQSRDALPAKIQEGIGKLESLLAREIEEHQKYLQELSWQERGEADRIHSAARRIEILLDSYHGRLGQVLANCPKPEKLIELLRDAKQQSTETQREVAKLRSVVAEMCPAHSELCDTGGRMLRVASQLEKTVGEIQREQAQRAAPPPAAPRPKAVPPKSKRAPLMAMFILALGCAWLNLSAASIGARWAVGLFSALCQTALLAVAVASFSGHTRDARTD